MKQICFWLIRGYQIILSPFVGQQCRFYPTCSVYTKQAIERFGVVQGIWMGIKRIIKCNPWMGCGGHDPIPEKESMKKIGKRA